MYIPQNTQGFCSNFPSRDAVDIVAVVDAANAEVEAIEDAVAVVDLFQY